MKATFLTGAIGFLLSLAVLLVSLLLPILLGGRASWAEAALGIVPGAFFSFVFLVVLLVGLFGMLNTAQQQQQQWRQTDEEADSGQPLKKGPSVGRVLSFMAAGLLAAAGLGAVGLILPAALESRRVWLYQQERVEQRIREMAELASRQDPASRARLDQMQRDRWSPETFRDEYQTRMLLVAAGAVCSLASLAAILVLWLRRPQHPADEPDEYEEPRRDRSRRRQQADAGTGRRADDDY